MNLRLIIDKVFVIKKLGISLLIFITVFKNTAKSKGIKIIRLSGEGKSLSIIGILTVVVGRL